MKLSKQTQWNSQRFYRDFCSPARTRRAHTWTWRGCTDRWRSKASVFWPKRCCRGGCSGTGWGWRRSSPYWSTPPAARTPGTPETCTVGEAWRVTTRASFTSADWSINIVVFIPLRLSDQSTLTAENDVELFLHIRFLVVSQYCAYFFMSVGYSEQSLIILKSLYCEDVMKCFKKLSLTMQLQSYWHFCNLNWIWVVIWFCPTLS